MKHSLIIFSVIGMINCGPLHNLHEERKSNVQKISAKRSTDDPKPAFDWTPSSRLEWLQMYLPKISETLKLKKRHTNDHNNSAGNHDEVSTKHENDFVQKEGPDNQEGIIPTNQLAKKSENWDSIEFDSYEDEENKKWWSKENDNEAWDMAQFDEIVRDNEESDGQFPEASEKYLEKRHAKKFNHYYDKKPTGKSEKHKINQKEDLLETLLQNWYGSNEESIESNEEAEQKSFNTEYINHESDKHRKHGHNWKTGKNLKTLYDIDESKSKKINKDKRLNKRSKASSKKHYYDFVENSSEELDVSESDIKIPRHKIRQDKSKNKTQIQKLNNLKKNSIQKQMKSDEDYSSESQSDEHKQRKFSKHKNSRIHNLSSKKNFRNKRDHSHRSQYDNIDNRDLSHLHLDGFK